MLSRRKTRCEAPKPYNGITARCCLTCPHLPQLKAYGWQRGLQNVKIPVILKFH
ncbi:hypothetical protein MRBBS_0859 [Marinobacter sp. BSs20148]|nr:hypothetical protein MRBBS_0859 [Marinobacter sp. BSs20148]